MIRIMKRVGKISRYLGQAWMAGVWLFLFGYFAFHAFQGDNSLAALKRLEVQGQELSVLAAKVAAERAALEARTAKLSSRAIDPDMLEEQVRLRLGFTHPDEVIVFLTASNRD
jgi:cell division protein FtsB